MIYICEKCYFGFDRIGEIDICPNCDKPSIREANYIEKIAFQKGLKDFEHNANANPH